MDEGSSAEIALLLRPSAGMGNDDKRDAGEGEIDSVVFVKQSYC
jgi:hypothetical protein